MCVGVCACARVCVCVLCGTQWRSGHIHQAMAVIVDLRTTDMMATNFDYAPTLYSGS